MCSHNSLSDVLNEIVKFGKQKFIVVTGGIGDFLTIDYLFNYGKTKYIIFISKQSLKLKYLFEFYYPENKFYSLYFDYSIIKKPGFDNTHELLRYFPQLKNIFTVNIADFFPFIRTNKLFNLNYHNIINKVVKHNIKDKYKLPPDYAIINPYTEDNRINCIKCNITHKGIQTCGLTRNFVSDDYLNIFGFLREKKLTGVLISLIPINIPPESNERIINLSFDKLDIIDCIELVKLCNYFFGVDSLFSVIASKNLPRDNIYVKCNNKHGYDNKDIYWYPNKDINLQSIINIKY